jgi:hypothetical protein
MEIISLYTNSIRTSQETHYRLYINQAVYSVSANNRCLLRSDTKHTNVEFVKAEEGGTYSYHGYFKSKSFSEVLHKRAMHNLSIYCPFQKVCVG